MLGDIVITHPFTQWSFFMTNILFMAGIVNEHAGSQLSLEGCVNHRKWPQSIKAIISVHPLLTTGIATSITHLHLTKTLGFRRVATGHNHTSELPGQAYRLYKEIRYCDRFYNPQTDYERLIMRPSEFFNHIKDYLECSTNTYLIEIDTIEGSCSKSISSLTFCERDFIWANDRSKGLSSYTSIVQSTQWESLSSYPGEHLLVSSITRIYVAVFRVILSPWELWYSSTPTLTQ